MAVFPSTEDIASGVQYAGYYWRLVSDRKNLIMGIGLIVAGIFVFLVGSFAVHMIESPEFDDLGRSLYSGVPRGWLPATIAQSIALGGVVVAMAGATLGWIYDRPMTWARAMLGAILFTSLMFVIFAVIPNQFLTLVQSDLEWTPQKIFITIPPILVLGNDVSISYAALKDMISAGFTSTMLIAIPVFMWWWQGRDERAAAPKPTPVSNYGRPMKVDS